MRDQKLLLVALKRRNCKVKVLGLVFCDQAVNSIGQKESEQKKVIRERERDRLK